MRKINEECGVFGVYSAEKYDIAGTVYYGLYSLQHRGQESAGIAVNDDGVLKLNKGIGLVNEVFLGDSIKDMGEGRLAVGHVRYGTTGTTDYNNAQPIMVNHIKGSMAIAHNGNLTNSYELRSGLELEGSIFHTTSDTEVIAYCITKERISAASIEEAVSRAMDKFEGAYSLVIMSPTKLIVVRDPYGLRPLCYGRTEDGRYIAASESCALDAVSAEFIRDVDPGEILVFDDSGVRSIREHCNAKPKKTCIFEYIYFARPDSIIDGISVHDARVKAGRILAERSGIEADVVIGVPDFGLDAAIGYSMESRIPYEIGFVKNKYIGRTFISPKQKNRENQVNIKLNVIGSVVKDKRVVLIDDSVVRGTTSKRIVEKLKASGAREVHLMLTAPPFVAPCYYGTDVPDTTKLIASDHNTEEVREYIGCDSLMFYSMDDLSEMIGCGRHDKNFCAACFSREYPAGVPKHTDKYTFEKRIGEKNERKRP